MTALAEQLCGKRSFYFFSQQGLHSISKRRLIISNFLPLILALNTLIRQEEKIGSGKYNSVFVPILAQKTSFVHISAVLRQNYRIHQLAADLLNNLNCKPCLYYYQAGIKMIIYTLGLLKIVAALSLEDLLKQQKHDPFAALLKYSQLPPGQVVRFNNKKLMFLTPWNQIGFQRAVQYAHKLDYVSPCWFQLKLDENQEIVMQGQHHIEEKYSIKWLQRIKQANPKLRVVPRVYMMDSGAVQLLYSSSGAIQIFKRFFDKISVIYDGLVFDSRYSVVPVNSQDFHFQPIKEIAEFLRGIFSQKPIIYTLPSFGDYKIQSIKILSQIVDFFAIVSLDYTRTTTNSYGLSPPWWLAKNLNYYKAIIPKEKLFFGLPAYGTQVQGERQKVVAVVQAEDITPDRVTKSSYHSVGKECIFETSKNTSIYLPCLSFMQARLNYLRKEGVGVYVWQGGQGPQQIWSLL